MKPPVKGRGQPADRRGIGYPGLDFDHLSRRESSPVPTMLNRVLHRFTVALKLADALLRVLPRREKCNGRAMKKARAHGVAAWTAGPQRGCTLKKVSRSCAINHSSLSSAQRQLTGKVPQGSLGLLVLVLSPAFGSWATFLHR